MPPAKAKQHIPEGTDDRPLYLCIEAVNERQVALAKKEIMRIIKEELVKLVCINSQFIFLYRHIRLLSVLYLLRYSLIIDIKEQLSNHQVRKAGKFI